MRAILTGQIGINKKSYVEAVAGFSGERGISLDTYHVGDRMYADAPDVGAGTILNLPLSRLHGIRRSVFKDIISESSGQENVILNTHATFRWRHGLFRAFDFDQVEKFRPDMFICMVDNIEAIYHRLYEEHTIHATFKDMIVWREEEILATELVALAVGCGQRCFVLPRGRGKATIETCFRLVCKPHLPKAYLSFPMSHVVDMPDVLAEIDEFRATLSKQLVAFDPGDVDEKNLMELAIVAIKEGRDFVDANAFGNDERMVDFQVPAKEIMEIASDIDGQIYARDFQLIDQSDMIISLVPELAGGVPGLSSGVERELHHAYEHGKQVYVVWKPKRHPSPFITETATRVFESTEQAVSFLRDEGILQEDA